MMKKAAFFLLFYSSLNTSAQLRLELSRPPALPEVFAANIISTGLNERDFALSPDGSEILYTLQSPQGMPMFQTILYTKKDKQGKWSQPEVAPFAGVYSNLEPVFSCDGEKVYFSSNRPITGAEVKDFDIWVVEKINGMWGEPRNIGAPVNTADDEFYPSVTKSGNLYFTAAYKNAVGKEDIYCAIWENGKYNEPVPLDTAVNSATYEFNAFVSPDEDFIIFTSYGRKDDKGRGDLYMSRKDALGRWQPAKNLSFINSDKIDYCPFVSADKKILFFTSARAAPKQPGDKAIKLAELINFYTGPQNGSGDIYFINFEKLMEYVSW
jgi:hypothetical protein